MPASSNFVLSKGRRASEAITKKRFVKMVAGGDDEVEMCDTDGEASYGVAQFSVSTAEMALGKLVSVQVAGRAVVEAGEAIQEGQPVKTMNNGKAGVATTGDHVLGMCDEPASADTKECSVLLGVGGPVI